jgi:hypothetical protein
MPDETKDSPGAQGEPAAPPEGARERTLDELLTEEEASAARREELRHRIEEKTAPSKAANWGERRLVILWTLALLALGGGYMASRAIEGEIVINWRKYPYWLWATVILGAAFAGLLARMVVAVVFARRRGGRAHQTDGDKLP